MADLASSAVTLIRGWTEGGTTGKQRKVWRSTVVVTAQGGLTNLIPASVFGMTVIEECSVGVSEANDLVLAAPSYDGASLLLFDVASATDATRDAPADFITTTIRITVKGY